MWQRTALFAACYAAATIILAFVVSFWVVFDWREETSRMVGITYTAAICHYLGQRDALRAFRKDASAIASEMFSAFRDLGDVKVTVPDRKPGAQ